MLAYDFMPQQPYVSRPEAEEFLAALDIALKSPTDNPVVFHVWGIGGVGKSTLLKKLVEDRPNFAIPLNNKNLIAFGQTEGINTPVALMRKLHGLLEPQFLNPSWFGRGLRSKPDPFTECYTQYFDAIHQLQDEAPNGNIGTSAEQVGLVKSLLKGLVQGGGALATISGNPVAGGVLTTASQGTDAVVDSVSLALSEKDRIQSLIASHKATRARRDLQELLLEPLPKLTQAFVKSLSQWSTQKPIVLVLDTYEKAELVTIDTWLWRTLLSNTNIWQYSIRLVIAGRYNLLKRQDWATVQQNNEIIKLYGPDTFTQTQTEEYLAKIHITDPAKVDRIVRVTKGWPYYLNKIRENQKSIDPEAFTQDLATFLVNHLPSADRATGKRLAQIAACCRWFDNRLIEFLVQQFKLLPPLLRDDAASDQSACFTWLKEQTFVEPSLGGGFRLDDVARDVFWASLWQEDRPTFERTHDLLARYFKAQSDHPELAGMPISEKYENDDWREHRGEYLYHLLFTRQANLQTVWLSHLLEATYLRQPELVQAPLQTMTAEYELIEYPYLSFKARKFLDDIWPAIEYGQAILEENFLNYPIRSKKFILESLWCDQTAIIQAVEICLNNPTQFEGLAQFAALLYTSKQCTEAQKPQFLQQAKAQAKQLAVVETSEFMADLWLYKLGNSFNYAGLLEEAVAAYDMALAINPEKYEALNNKGCVLHGLGRYEDAISIYKKALNIKPHGHDSLYNKGIALGYLGRYQEAIAAYDDALFIKPNNYSALNNKGDALRNLGRYEEAIATFDAALDIKPNLHEAWDNLGYTLAKAGQVDEAIAKFDQAIGINTQYANAVYNKAFALSLKENLDEVCSLLQQAFTLDPKYRDMAKTDTDFDSIRADERFRALVEGDDQLA